MPQSIDTLIEARWIVPVEPDQVVLEDHAIAIYQGRIVAIETRARARELYTAGQIVTLDQHVLAPGLINTHTHAAMTLFRGLADDLPLMEWLNKHIWPAEQHWSNEPFVRAGTQLAIVNEFSNAANRALKAVRMPDDELCPRALSRLNHQLGVV